MIKNQYAIAISTESYNEMRSRIEQIRSPPGLRVLDAVVITEADEVPVHEEAIGMLLIPDRATVEEALQQVAATKLSRFVSDYLETSERISRLCISLHHCCRRARSLYSQVEPHLVPDPQTSRDADKAFDALLRFDQCANPFPSPSPSSPPSPFHTMSQCFLELKRDLKSHIGRLDRQLRRFHHATRASGVVLVACAVGFAITALVLVTHAAGLVIAVASPTACFCQNSALLGKQRRRLLLQKIEHLDAADKVTFGVKNNLGTIEKLVVKLHSMVESDKTLVRLGVERGPGYLHLTEEVLRHLHNNYPKLQQELTSLDEHICFYFSGINRARTRLLHYLHWELSNS